MKTPSSGHTPPVVRLSSRLVLAVLVGIGVLAVLAGMLIARWSNQPSGNSAPTLAASPSASQKLPANSPSPGDTGSAAASGSPSPSGAHAPAQQRWPRQLQTGPWPTSHVQGIAVDRKKGFIYYSFTTLLVKTDMHGKLVGTVGGFTGHLGDLAFNPDDGKVYGSLEYKDAEAFYVAIFDVDRIDREGMQAKDSTILSTVYLPEVVADFTADLNGDGKFAGDTAQTADHRYGCSGIDGVAFGPKFGHTGGRSYLTVAYGIYDNVTRTDNDHQVLIQYDITGWQQVARPLTEGNAHHVAPPEPGRKYFVYTGNTHYGVQTLTYDPWLTRWFLGVYKGQKPQFPNYTLYAVDAASQPKVKALKGLHGATGPLLPLAKAGLDDQSTGIRGWRSEAAFGLESLGDGLYYIAQSSTSNGSSSARLVLQSWTGDADKPFKPVEQ